RDPVPTEILRSGMLRFRTAAGYPGHRGVVSFRCRSYGNSEHARGGAYEPSTARVRQSPRRHGGTAAWPLAGRPRRLDALDDRQEMGRELIGRRDLKNIVEGSPPAEPSMLSRPEIRHGLSCRRSRTDFLLHAGNTAVQESADCSGTSTPRRMLPREP